MALLWGHVFIWLGIGFILVRGQRSDFQLLSGIIISSIRRSYRRGQLSKIPRKAMTVFKAGFFKKDMANTVEAELHKSLQTKLASATAAPTKGIWGWSTAESDLGEVNYQFVVLSSPRLIEHAARVHSKQVWIRPPNHSMEAYLAMISSKLPSISEKSVEGYLKRYNAVRFEGKEISKRQYTTWLGHLMHILQQLDQMPSPEAEIEITPKHQLKGDKIKKKRGKKPQDM